MNRAVWMTGMVALAALVGCGPGESARNADGESLSGTVQVDGSSTVFPITEAVAEEFQGDYPGARVTVGVSGTGGGFKKFCAGETDVSNASRVIKETEVALCEEGGIEWVELPVAYDGVAVVVNPDNDWVDEMSVEELRMLWEPAAQGEVLRWNQIRPEWPDQEIHLYGPGVDSGTFDYFTKAINGEEGSSRGDFTASEDDNVLVQGISNDRLALGFFGFAYYDENRERLKIVPINDGDDTNGAGAIVPSVETVKNSTYQPLSRPVFIYVATQSLDSPIVAEFVEYYLENAPELTAEVGYIPLPSGAYQAAKQRVEERVTGSMFGEDGSTVGVSIEEVLRTGMTPADDAAESAEETSADTM